MKLIKYLRSKILLGLSLAILTYMMIPLALIIILSFNRPKGRQNTAWNQFTLDAWTNICRDPTICRAFSVSVQIAVLVTVIATIIGTMISFALVRHKFSGKDGATLGVFIPLSTPDVILGASLLALFLNIFIPLGFWTVVLAQITFTISFVVVVVNARLAGMDPRLEQAAMDLYATPFQTFRYVTFPLALPGIAAAALISLSLSFDDYIITSFNSGRIVTFPIYIWGAAQRGIPPQVNVIASLMFLGSLALVALAAIITRRLRLKAFA
ncbi:MAG: ABC transporter permease [Candidatus Nanopelagicales bacterium]